MLDLRPKRNSDTLSPSERKNLELFDKVLKTQVWPGGAINRWHGRKCGDCQNWPACEPEIGKQSQDMDYCARMSRGWKTKEQGINASIQR